MQTPNEIHAYLAQKAIQVDSRTELALLQLLNKCFESLAWVQPYILPCAVWIDDLICSILARDLANPQNNTGLIIGTGIRLDATSFTSNVHVAIHTRSMSFTTPLTGMADPGFYDMASPLHKLSILEHLEISESIKNITRNNSILK